MHRHPVPHTLHNVSWRLAGALAAAVVAASCGGGGGSTSSATTATGSIRLALTDAPGCGFDHMNVTVEKLRVHTDSAALDTDPGWVEIPVSPARRVDLLALTNGAFEELGTAALPAGHYAQLSVVFAANANGAAPANSVLPTGAASEVALATFDGLQAGITLPVSFDVTAGQVADLVTDVDACSSVVTAGNSGGWYLQPRAAVLPRVASGIRGTLSSALTPSGTTVSAQQDGTVIRSTQPDASGNFSLPYLAPGSYTLVIASDGHATGVVTGVQVGAGTTVNAANAPIDLPAASMGEVSGALTMSGESDAGTPVEGAVTDALVRARQMLSSGASIDVRRRPVDGVLGTYRMAVPKATPMVAAWQSSGALSFQADASDAGRYSLDFDLR
jgi:hypothetical protein